MKISTSGLIKVPKDLLEKVTELVVSKMLSYANANTEREDVYAPINFIIMSYVKKNNIKLMDEIDTFQANKIDITDFISDLPKSYYNFDTHFRLLKIGLDNVNEKSEAYLSPPNEIYICTRPLRKILFGQKHIYLLMIENYIDGLRATVEHELTHFIQHVFLHEHNRKKATHYDSRKDDFTFDDYYSSNVELDPQTKDAIAKFISLLKDYYNFSNWKDEYDVPYDMGAKIKTFVGALKEADVKYDYRIGTNPFFTTLKRTRPKAWKRAVKALTLEIMKRVPVSVRKYWHLEW